MHFGYKKPSSSSHRLSIFNHVPFLHDVFLVPFNFSEKKQECIKSRSRNAELGINAIFIFCFISWFFYSNIGKFQCFSHLAKITLLLNWFSVVIHTESFQFRFGYWKLPSTTIIMISYLLVLWYWFFMGRFTGLLFVSHQ